MLFMCPESSGVLESKLSSIQIYLEADSGSTTGHLSSVPVPVHNACEQWVGVYRCEVYMCVIGGLEAVLVSLRI